MERAGPEHALSAEASTFTATPKIGEAGKEAVEMAKEDVLGAVGHPLAPLPCKGRRSNISY